MGSPTGCCARKSRREESADPLDRRGYVDHVRVTRAMSGQAFRLVGMEARRAPEPDKLSRAEIDSLVIRLHGERNMGLTMIAAHVGISRSQAAEILARYRKQASP